MPPAVGLITYGTDRPAPGAAICTGTLVAPDLVLTARHCLEMAQATPGMVRFAAEAALGRRRALARGVEVILPGVEITRMRANDVALLRLARPIPPGTVPPLPLAGPVPPAGAYVVFAHDRAAPDQPATRKDCQHRGEAPGVLALSCPVASGNSGAAVLIRTGEGWQIAAVMVASLNQDGARSLAALVPADLRAITLAPPGARTGMGEALRFGTGNGPSFLSPLPNVQAAQPGTGE